MEYCHSCNLGDWQTMMAQRPNLPLDAHQPTSIRISDRIPRNKDILQLESDYSAM